MTTARMKRVFGVFALLVTATASWAYAADWPQINGPTRDAVSTEKGLLKSWPEAGPKVLWTTAVGGGYGGPVVRDGELYFLDRVDDQKDILRCFDLATGAEKWRYEYDCPGKVGHTGSRTPPTVDDKYVYSVGLMGNFLCVDRKTHKPVWQKNLMTDFGMELPQWGYSQAPLLYKNLVIVAPQAKDAMVAAYDRVSGNLVWKSPSFGLPGYVSPIVYTLDGVDQVVMIAANDKPGTIPGGVAGFSVTDGSLLWKYEGWQCFIPIAYPVLLPGDRLFISAGYKAGSATIEVKKGEKGWEAKELYKLPFDVCGVHIPQPILYKDYLYLNSNSNERNDGMACFALDGTRKWNTAATEGLPLFERGSLILADGMIVALDGKTGILYLVDPSPDGYKQIAQAKVLEGKEMWAPLALCDGKLIVRSQDTMKCLDLKTP
jgi:outer membrane protein assembly factor BamB